MTVADIAHERTPLLKNGSGQDANDASDCRDAAVPSQDAEAAAGATKEPLNVLTIFMPLALGVFLVALDGTIALSSSAAIGSELNQLQNTSWILTGYMMTLTSFQPLYGKLSDIFGRKACVLFAYTVFGLGSLLCGLAQDMNQLIAARAFAGIGGGGINTVSSIIFSDIIPPRSRGTFQGFMNIVFAVGSSTGAPLGGILADTIGWRWSFLIQVPAIALGILAVAVALHLPARDESHLWQKLKRVDFGGAGALVAAVFCLLYGLDRGGNVAWRDVRTAGALALSAVLALVFGLVETRWAREPLAPARIVASRALVGAYLVNFFALAAALTTIFEVSLYFQAVLGKSAGTAGVLLIPNIIGGMAGSLASGVLMQATGKYYWLTVGVCALMAGGSLVLCSVTGLLAHSLPGVVVGLVLCSFGNGAAITTTLIALIANAGPRDQAVATALSYLFRSLGSVVGLSVGSTIVQETLRGYLRQHLSGSTADEIIRRVRASLAYLDALDPTTRALVRAGYARAVRAALALTLALGVCTIVTALFIRETPLQGKAPAAEPESERSAGADAVAEDGRAGGE